MDDRRIVLLGDIEFPVGGIEMQALPAVIGGPRLYNGFLGLLVKIAFLGELAVLKPEYLYVG